MSEVPHEPTPPLSEADKPAPVVDYEVVEEAPASETSKASKASEADEIIDADVVAEEVNSPSEEVVAARDLKIIGRTQAPEESEAGTAMRPEGYTDEVWDRMSPGGRLAALAVSDILEGTKFVSFGGGPFSGLGQKRPAKPKVAPGPKPAPPRRKTPAPDLSAPVRPKTPEPGVPEAAKPQPKKAAEPSMPKSPKSPPRPEAAPPKASGFSEAPETFGHVAPERYAAAVQQLGTALERAKSTSPVSRVMVKFLEQKLAATQTPSDGGDEVVRDMESLSFSVSGIKAEARRDGRKATFDDYTKRFDELIKEANAKNDTDVVAGLQRRKTFLWMLTDRGRADVGGPFDEAFIRRLGDMSEPPLYR